MTTLIATEDICPDTVMSALFLQPPVIEAIAKHVEDYERGTLRLVNKTWAQIVPRPKKLDPMEALFDGVSRGSVERSQAAILRGAVINLSVIRLAMEREKYDVLFMLIRIVRTSAEYLGRRYSLLSPAMMIATMKRDLPLCCKMLQEGCSPDVMLEIALSEGWAEGCREAVRHEITRIDLTAAYSGPFSSSEFDSLIGRWTGKTLTEIQRMV